MLIVIKVMKAKMKRYSIRACPEEALIKLLVVMI